MKINIVMAAYNNSQLTKRTIDSVIKNTFHDYKYFIINNCSTDDTDDVINSFLPNEKIEYIISEKNSGCGHGRNQGLNRIEKECDYVILIDNDIYCPKNWDKKLVDFMEYNKSIGLAGPSTNYAGTPQMIKNCPTFNSDQEIEKYAEELYSSKKKHIIVQDKWPVIGFCQIIRKCVIDLVGVFDENFKLYGCEDNDYCYRVQSNGWKLAYINNIFVYHHGHGGLSMLGTEGIDQWTKNREYFKEKNGFL